MRAYVIQFDEEVWDDASLTNLTKTGRKLYHHTNYRKANSGDISQAKFYYSLAGARKDIPKVTFPSMNPVILEVELTAVAIKEVE